MKNKNWQIREEIRTPVCCCWECKVAQLLRTAVWWFFNRVSIKHIVTVRPSTSAPGYIPNRNENVCPPRNICIQMFIAALCITVQLLQLVIIAKRGKKPRHPSVDEWINKVWPVHTMEYFSAIKRNGELVVQWLGLCAFTAEGPGSVPAPGPRILQVRWYGQKNKKKE